MKILTIALLLAVSLSAKKPPKPQYRQCKSVICLVGLKWERSFNTGNYMLTGTLENNSLVDFSDVMLEFDLYGGSILGTERQSIPVIPAGRSWYFSTEVATMKDDIFVDHLQPARISIRVPGHRGAIDDTLGEFSPICSPLYLMRKYCHD